VNKEQEIEQLREMVRMYKYDHLTGLKMRIDFEYEIRHKFNTQPFWFTMIDANGLHGVNRRDGYAAGDALIRRIAECVKRDKSLWEAYRIGGDEFILIGFERPTIDCMDEATIATKHSRDYTSFDDMVKDVDRLVTEKKVSADRRAH